MKVTPKVMEEVISEVAGTDVVDLIKLLKNKKNVSEFKLAEKMKLEVNTTRNMLYRLYDANLVSFMRKKDKKKGWYIYYWTFDSHKIKYVAANIKQKKLERLRKRLEREQTSQFFVCPEKCIRFDFDQAMNFDFKCPECGQVCLQDDNSEKIQAIQKEVDEIENSLKKEKFKKISARAKVASKTAKKTTKKKTKKKKAVKKTTKKKTKKKKSKPKKRR